jgi:vitamin B12 transporter
VGVDYNIEKIDSSTAFVNEERNVLGVFAQTSLEQDSYDLEAAIRFDEVEDLDSETSFNLSAGKELTDTLRLVASYGTGFKTPTFNDLYYPSGVYSSGNADLKAETSDSAEFILQFQQDKLTASISLYKTNVENLIQWQADANFVYKPQNIAKVNIQGIEAEAQYIAEYGTHSVNFSINESVDDATDEQLIRRSKEHFNYSFSTTVGDADVYVEYQYKGESYDEDFVLGRLTLPSYSLLNLAASYPITSNLSVKGRISNGLDEKYQSAYNYNTAGQTWYLGLTYSL